MVNVFAPQVFFIAFRECLEAVIVISVLLSFLKQALGQPDQDQHLYKRLRKQVWFGAIGGLVICLLIGVAFIAVFYTVGHDLWAKSEDLWEGIFYLIACIIITIMGLAILRINKMQDKWKIKIAQSFEAHSNNHSRFWVGDWSRRYVMFFLPFITTLREGLEAVVFIGGVSLGYPATAFPIPVITGLLAGLIIGLLIYKGGNALSIKLFMIASTCVLYLIAAGMFSKSIWMFQNYVFVQGVGADVSEAGSGPGSYDITQTVWHVNCCNPERDNGWDVFNAILGWQNTATYGSVISYNVYWLFIMFVIGCMLYEERTGSLPFATQTKSFFLKVPVIGGHLARKDAARMTSTEADEIFSRAQTNVLGQKNGKVADDGMKEISG